MKRQYKIIVKDGIQLCDVFTRVEEAVNDLMTQGWDESDSVHVMQCGSRFVVYKEMLHIEFEPQDDSLSEWHTTVTGVTPCES